jgi:seryl-tRNA synthetase
MNADELYRAAEGFATLGPELTEAFDVLETHLLAWAKSCLAERMVFPPLVAVADLATLDYFQNFPHLVLLAAPLDRGGLPEEPGAVVADQVVPREHLAQSRYALPSAACYSVYLHLRDSVLPAPRYVTTTATCFRQENHYDGLRRLRGFHMREIVCIGPPEDVQAHLSTFKPRILEFARSLGLNLEIRAAGDPFFQPHSERAVLQQLFPVKEEFVHADALAVASVNFHRNFFGERCRIRLADGSPAFTGCVAFGLERWLAALIEIHGPGSKAILDALTLAAGRSEGDPVQNDRGRASASRGQR